MKSEASFSNFSALDIRAGEIEKVEDFEKARDPAYKIWVDFGEEIGTLKTSAKLKDLYSEEDLVGKTVVGIINFPDKQIADFMSEFLILGALEDDGTVVLTTEKEVEPGTEIA
ncbi:MAG: tRNA-binding protein [Candidatus Nanohaloarchaeota archaeon QJJ-9]|nr:tRNA-binding protein [Candidatus Nanohaloarchaeota archaeon QJJ-9]